MLFLKSFCFNAFQENTYVVYDDEKTAFIIDPGNSEPHEDKIIKDFISEKKLQLKRLLLTHGHIDHILGNAFIYEEYGLTAEVHQADLFFLERLPQTAAMYGVEAREFPMPKTFLKENGVVELGKYKFDCIFTPGHSPGSLCFFNRETKLLIGGDVLFFDSIGRTDLPLGDHATLINSIKEKLFPLGDDVKVYPGHGPSTTIGHERQNNPFLT